MPTTTTKTLVYARPMFSRDHDRSREVWGNGVTGTEDDYGKVQIVRSVITETRASGDVGRILDRHTDEEVLCAVNAEGATHLIKTLSIALVAALEVRPPAR